MKYKKLYLVFTTTKHGIGLQPTKGNSKKQARDRFKKRFPKNQILSIDLAEENYKPVLPPL